jgi:hypothetical protein
MKRNVAVVLLSSPWQAVRKSSCFRFFFIATVLLLVFAAAAYPQSAISSGFSGQVID